MFSFWGKTPPTSVSGFHRFPQSRMCGMMTVVESNLHPDNPHREAAIFFTRAHLRFLADVWRVYLAEALLAIGNRPMGFWGFS